MLQAPACNSSMLLLELSEKFPLAYKTKQCHPWEVCRKTCFAAGRAVFWSLSGYQELKLTKQPFSGCSIRDLPLQMYNTNLRGLSMRRKILGVKGHMLPSSFALLTPFSFFCCVCTRLHFGGKWFWGESF